MKKTILNFHFDYWNPSQTYQTCIIRPILFLIPKPVGLESIKMTNITTRTTKAFGKRMDATTHHCIRRQNTTIHISRSVTTHPTMDRWMQQWVLVYKRHHHCLLVWCQYCCPVVFQTGFYSPCSQILTNFTAHNLCKIGGSV